MAYPYAASCDTVSSELRTNTLHYCVLTTGLIQAYYRVVYMFIDSTDWLDSVKRIRAIADRLPYTSLAKVVLGTYVRSTYIS